MAFSTVEGIDNNEKEDDETTKPARDDVGGDDEADPGDNDKEIEWEIYLIEDCGKLRFILTTNPQAANFPFSSVMIRSSTS